MPSSARVWPPRWPSAPGPISTHTPARPITTPPSRCALNRSSPQACATSAVKSGVVALRIDASPLVSWTCPHAISPNGTKLFNAPRTTNPAHIRGEAGIRCPARRAESSSASAAMPKRPSTSVHGGSSASATLLKKKDTPHSIDSTPSSAHSRPVISTGIRGRARNGWKGGARAAAAWRPRRSDRGEEAGGRPLGAGDLVEGRRKLHAPARQRGQVGEALHDDHARAEDHPVHREVLGGEVGQSRAV